MHKWQSWDQPGGLMERHIASSVFTPQLENPVQAGLNRSLVDAEAGQDIVGAFVDAISEGSGERSQDVRIPFTVTALEAIAESGSDAVERAAQELLNQLRTTTDSRE